MSKFIPEKLKTRLKVEIDSDPIDAMMARIHSVLKYGGTEHFQRDKDFSFLGVTALITTTSCFVYVGQASQWHFLLRSDDKAESYKAFNCITTTAIPLTEMLWMQVYRARIRSTVKLAKQGIDLVYKHDPEDRSIQDNMRNSKSSFILGRASIYFTHIAFVIVPAILTVVLGRPIFPEVAGECIGLSPRLQSPNFEISYIILSIATAFAAINITGFSFLFYTLLNYTLAQIAGLSKRFESIGKTLDQNDEILTNKFDSNIQKSMNLEKSLRYCAIRHQFILDFIDEVSNMFKHIFSVHFFIMTIILITLSQTAFTSGLVNTALSAVVSICPLAMYCIGGELLIIAGANLNFAIYDCRWEYMQPRHARIVLLMLKMSQKTLCLKASGLYVLDVETFGGIMQLVYKVYAVIR